MPYHKIRRAKRTSLLRPALLSAALLDELGSGLPVVALPLIRDDFSLSYEQVGLLFAVGNLASMFLEPVINILGDRGSKRGLVLLGAVGLAVGFVLAAIAWGYAWLLLAFALLSPAKGAAVGLSQATLIDQSVGDAPRTMTRWTIMGSIGKLIAPLTVTIVIAYGLGWRPLFWLAAGLWLLLALVLRLQAFPQPKPPTDATGQPLSTIANLRTALCNAALVRWTVVLLIASMLEDTFLGFAALLLSDVIEAAPGDVSLALGAQMVGATLGLLVLERLLTRYSGGTILRALALLTLFGVGGLLMSRWIEGAAVALFVIGFGVSGWYPLAKAAAYATLPGRSGTVRAVNDTLGVPFEVVLPVVVGFASDRFGVLVGVALLGLAPLGILLLTPRARPGAQSS